MYEKGEKQGDKHLYSIANSYKTYEQAMLQQVKGGGPDAVLASVAGKKGDRGENK